LAEYVTNTRALPFGKLAEFLEELRLQTNRNHLLYRAPCNLIAAFLYLGGIGLGGLAASLFVFAAIVRHCDPSRSDG
jgi:hypothetical protein